MVFTGLTGDTFNLLAQSSVSSDGTNRSSVQGIQIVSGTVPEPSGLIVLAAGGLAGAPQHAANKAQLNRKYASIIAARLVQRGGHFLNTIRPCLIP